MHSRGPAHGSFHIKHTAHGHTMRHYNTLLLMSALLLFTSCDEKPPQATTDKPAAAKTQATEDYPLQFETLTEGEQFFVRITPAPAPVPFQELFSLNVTLLKTDRTTPVKNASIDDVQAIMPAHNHGMNVKPHITPQGDGQFLIEGMRFHMRGDGDDGLWVLKLAIQDKDSATIDTTALPMQCCKISR